MDFKLILQHSTQNLKNTSISSLTETEIQSVRNHIPNYITGIRDDHSHPKITESSPFYDYSYIWGGGACLSWVIQRKRNKMTAMYTKRIVLWNVKTGHLAMPSIILYVLKWSLFIPFGFFCLMNKHLCWYYSHQHSYLDYCHLGVEKRFKSKRIIDHFPLKIQGSRALGKFAFQ